MDQTSARKANHVDIVLNERVDYTKSTGLEKYEFVHNALPEIDYTEIDTRTKFLGHEFSAPVMVASMTGGFGRAEEINRALAGFCATKKIGMGVGSQRQALEDSGFVNSFRIARKVAPDIFIMGNIGAAQIADGISAEKIRVLLDMVGANALAVHLNALQELVQPEGDRNFKGVLRGIERIVSGLKVPVVVKETGAGIGADAARRLIGAGVSAIDVSGAGGTSWAAIETLRRNNRRLGEKFWNWGIPTAEALVQVQSLASRKKIKIIASGGIRDGIDVAKSLALGADLCAAAQPFLKALEREGASGLEKEFDDWIEDLKGVMFLTGSKNIAGLKKAKIVKVTS